MEYLGVLGVFVIIFGVCLDSRTNVAASTACGGRFVSSYGVITSPNYPQNYPLHTVCEWFIENSNEHPIVLYFLAFQTKLCCDYLEIRDGNSTGTLLGNYHGPAIPGKIQSSGYQLYLKFISDDLYVDPGFKISWHSTDVCGGHFNSSIGTILSPNYPQNYPDDIVCEWTIEDPNKHPIVLNFETFRTSSYHDFLEIRNGDSEGHSLFGIFEGYEIAGIITRSGYQMYLTFRTNEIESFQGFKISWDNNNNVCGGRFSSSIGTILSPNYPRNYRDDTVCEWFIEDPNKHPIVLNFETFETERLRDYLEIRNGDSVHSPLVGTFSGSTIPARITSSGYKMYLMFRTDVSNVNQGFKISWSSATIDRRINVGASMIFGGRFNSSITPTEVVSPNYPQNYPDNTVCEWIIQVPNKHRIELNFETFETEGTVDYLEIRSGVSAASPLVETFSGLTIPARFTSSGYEMYLKFRSDHSVSLRGFKIFWSSITDPQTSDSTICGGHLKSAIGTVLSPNYPQNYPHDTVCEWIIEDPNKHPIVLNFEMFRTQQSLDYLEIRNGDSVLSPLMGTFSGSTIPPRITSSGYKMYLMFRTDGSDAYQGFKISWGNAINDSQTNVGASTICGGHYNSSIGIVVSPNYPENYSNNTVCEWIVEEPSQQRILLNFETFKTEGTTDYLEIRNGGSAASPLVGTFSGSSIPARITSSGYQMYLKFRTDNSVSLQGFKIFWSSIIGSYASGSSSKTVAFGGHFHSLKGTVTSPNYPQNYPDDVDFEWVIEIPEHHTAVLKVIKFHIESSSGCANDYLEIRNGTYVDASTLLGKYCGTDIPQIITCPGSRTFLRFKTDRTGSNEGFVIEWDSMRLDSQTNVGVPMTCGGHFNSSIAPTVVMSPNYPQNYADNTVCEWIIEEPNKHRIALNFETFKTEGPVDYLEIRNGASAASPLVGTFSGSSIPARITSSGYQMYLKFRSDNSVSFQGFKILGTSIIDSQTNASTICGGRFKSSTGTILSPNYPQNYRDDTVCEWIIEDLNENPIVLNFETFETESSKDYLEIRNGDSVRSPLVGTFSGSTIPPTIAISGYKMYLMFKTDHSDVYQGFKISWGNTIIDSQTNVGVSPLCGGHFNSSITPAFVVSPNHPENYPNNTVCEWIIEEPNKHRIVLNFDTFETEGTVDYLEIRNGASAASPLVGTFSGSAIPAKITSSDYRMYLKFRSDHSVSHRGFKIFWSSIIDSQTSASRVCGGHFNSSIGTILSPDYPRNYGDDTVCEWIIEDPNEHPIVLNFEMFRTQQSLDYLEIRNGDSVLAPLVGTFSGSTIPPRITSSGYKLYLMFRTDGSNVNQGFKISWSSATIDWQTNVGASMIFGGRFNSSITPTEVVSPNYPQNYPNNTVCEWIIQVPNKHRIVLNFETFETEGTVDYLEIRSGVSAASPLVETFSGLTIPARFTSSGYQLYLKFRSDHSFSLRGFKIFWSSITDPGTSDSTICGGHLKSAIGTVLSPNYPQNYPHDTVCEWIIEDPNEHPLVLNFEMFRTEDSLDYLEIRNGDSVLSPLMGTFSGSTITPRITSSGYKMYLMFRTDGYDAYQGFKISWGNAITDSQTHVGASMICGGHYNSSIGIVVSPNYPENYSNNTVCEWIIEEPGQQRIVLNFETFKTERTTDYLEIRNGGSAASPLVGTFSGSAIPARITSSGYQIYLKFRSDASVSLQGFRIFWSSIFASYAPGNSPQSSAVSGHLHSLKGTVTSPNYPQNYPDDVDFEWVIEIPEHHTAVLKVIKFHIESSSGCANDYLEIRNGTYVDASTLMGKYCGTDIPQKITCSGSRLFLRFKTDTSVNYAEGFVIEWDSMKPDCGGSLVSGGGVMTSPNYPESYSLFGECDWNIRVSAGSIIQFVFLDLDFEATEQCRFDFIEIYEGNDNRGKKLGTYCRTINYPLYVQSSSNVASVRVRTSSTVAPRRFRIVYHTICGSTVHGSEGAIESPNFPDKYPDRDNCSWIIEAPIGQTLNLTFSQFDLDGGVGNSCDNDYLEIMEGKGDKPSRHIGKFCNSKQPPATIVTTQRQVFLKFHSDNSSAGNGFRLEWISNVHNVNPPSPRDDYTYTPGNSGHKLHTQATTWNEARTTCKEEGGHLAIINSIPELNAIIQLFKNSETITGSQNPNYTLIGISDLYSEGEFLTIHDQTLITAGFAHWETGQPDNHEGSENCGALSVNGELNDVNCASNYGFICEIPAY